MAKSKTKSAVPYIQQLIQDKSLQEELSSAASGLRSAYERARKKGAQATEDKKLYSDLRQAATSIRKVATTLAPPKRQHKRRFQAVIAAALAAGSALLVIKQQKDQSKAQTGSEKEASPVNASGPAQGAAPRQPAATSSA